MTRMLLVCGVIVAFSTSWAQAQLTTFRVAADPTGNDRSFPDTPGVCEIYIFQDGSAVDISGVSFKMKNNGFTGVWLSDASSFTTMGASQTGIYIYSNVCWQVPTLVLSVEYLCQGTSGCTTVTLEPHPLEGVIEAIECNVGPGGAGVIPLCVNGVAIPDDNNSGPCDCTLPAEQSTWGGIKSIFDSSR